MTSMELSPELCNEIETVLGKVIREVGYGPGTYLVLLKAEAAREQTLCQYDWFWRPEDVPPDLADARHGSSLSDWPRDLPPAGSPPPGHHCPPDAPCPVLHDDRRY